MELTVMIYNIHHGRSGDGASNLDGVARLVRESGADLVGFNEVDRFFGRRSGFIDQYAWLADRLGMHGAFGAAITRRKGDVVREYGNALLSRFPIRRWTNHGYRAKGLLVSEPRAVLETEVDLGPAGTASVFVTHLSYVPVLQRIQTDLLAKRLADAAGPAVLMGDMNMRPGSASWRKLCTSAEDAGMQANGEPLLTFPSLRPITQKDYIFATREFTAVRNGIVNTAPSLSDHLPLWANLRLSDKSSY